MFSFLGSLFTAVGGGRGLHLLVGSDINKIFADLRESDRRPGVADLNDCSQLVCLYLWTNRHILHLGANVGGQSENEARQRFQDDLRQHLDGRIQAKLTEIQGEVAQRELQMPRAYANQVGDLI